MDINDEQPRKASTPIFVTLCGIINDFNRQQPSKAPEPIFFMLLGRMTVFKVLHP